MFDSAHHSDSGRAPSRVFVDPEFGILSQVAGFWVGRVQSESGLIRFMVVGNDLAPNIGLLQSARLQIARFHQVEHQALRFIFTHEPEARGVEDLAFVSIDFLRADSPENFEVEFLSEDFRFWLVEFEAAQPRYSGWFFEFGAFAALPASLHSTGLSHRGKLRELRASRFLPA